MRTEMSGRFLAGLRPDAEEGHPDIEAEEISGGGFGGIACRRGDSGGGSNLS